MSYELRKKKEKRREKEKKKNYKLRAVRSYELKSGERAIMNYEL